MQEIEYLVQNKISKICKALSIVLAIFLLVVGGGLQLRASSSTRQELEEAQQNANRVQGEIEQGKEALEKLEKDKNKISSQLKDYNAQLTTAVNELNDTEQAIALKELEIEQKLRELDIAKGIEEKQYNDLVSHMQYMYESGLTQSYLNLVSESTSLTDFLNISEYVEQISAYDTRMLAQFKQTREFIE